MRGAISGLAVGMAEFALDSVIIGASANLLTAPLAFLFFGFSSLYSIPATVLFSPLAGLAVTLALCTAAVIICACALCRVGRGKYFKFCFTPCLRMRGTCL
jgi:predicted membrane metal-binding protein